MNRLGLPRTNPGHEHFMKCQKYLVMAVLSLAVVNTNSALNLATLYNFSPLVSGVNGDGAMPAKGDLVLSGDTLYGTASKGGGTGNGTVFKVNTDGTGFATLHDFSGTADGFDPEQSLILSGNQLYGDAFYGGSGGGGVIFSLNTDGTGFHAILGSTYSEGSDLNVDLLLSGNTIYGTADGGGANGEGSVFKVNTDGTGHDTFYSFSSGTAAANSPAAGLIMSGNALYGTTWSGGSGFEGTVFTINTDGTGYSVLHNFDVTDGISPEATLILSGNTLYGSATSGGGPENGVLFKINTDGSGFTLLHVFSALVSGANSDGADPWAQLTLSGNTLYGTTIYGGSGGTGTIFEIQTDGTGFTTLYNFSPLISGVNNDGANPYGGLILTSDKLYGTTANGGTGASGTIYSMDLSGICSNDCISIFNPNDLMVTTCSNSLPVAYAATVLDSCCTDSNVDCVTITYDPPSGASFGLGTTTVTTTATDTLGNSNTCTFTVTVVQSNNPPIITSCPTSIYICTDTNTGCGPMPDATGQVLAPNPGGGDWQVSQDIAPGTVICNNTNVTFTVTNVCGQATNRTVPVVLTNCCCESLLQRPWGATLTNITVWELTGAWTRHDFSVVPFSPKLLKLPGALTVTNNDFATSDQEYYDVYLSDADGTADTNGCCVTVDCYMDETMYDYSSGGNIGGVELDFSDGTVLGASSIGNVQLGGGITDPALLASQGQATNALGLHNETLVPVKTTYLGYGNSTITVCFEAPCVGSLAWATASPVFGGNLTLSWPTTAGRYQWQLQESTDLRYNNWTAVPFATNPPVLVTNFMIPQQYYRLILFTNFNSN
jgi:uncharacterized repeat protein (TIGR03803 family)